jgi:hypothetical protein
VPCPLLIEAVGGLGLHSLVGHPKMMTFRHHQEAAADTFSEMPIAYLTDMVTW